MRVKGEGREEVWLCCGDRQQGRIAVISAIGGQWHMEVPKNDVSVRLQHSSNCHCVCVVLQVGSRVISVSHVCSDLVVLGTLDFNLHAFHCTSK